MSDDRVAFIMPAQRVPVPLLFYQHFVGVSRGGGRGGTQPEL